MSLHIIYDHQCSKCEAHYIPYDKDVACPNCGTYEEEIADFIVSIIASSANHQMNTIGMYTPIAWWTGSLGDHAALLIFQCLDAYESQKKKSFEEFAQIYFDKVQWDNQLYMKRNIYGLSCKVFELLNNEQYYPKPKLSFKIYLLRVKQKLKSMFEQFTGLSYG